MTTGTLLHLLAYVGRHEAIRWLLDSGAYSHSVNHVGSTPLHVAAVRRHPETIKVLRFFHADAYTENQVYIQWTPSISSHSWDQSECPD